MGLFSGRAQRQAFIDSAEHLEKTRKANALRIKQGQTGSLEAIGSGFKKARGSYGDAIDLYQPYATTGTNAFNLYADALGVNGADKATAARAAFKESPGYQYQVDQATDAVARKASALGALGSGNTMQAVSDRAQNLADQEWGGWLSNLNGMGQMGYSATGNQANLTRGIGDLYAGEGTAKAGVIGNFTNMGVNNSNNAASQWANGRMSVADAGSKASANAWGLGMNLAKLGAGFVGGGGITELKSLFA